MKYFYHAQTEKYRARLVNMILVVSIPLLAVCVFCVVNIVLNLSEGFGKSIIRIMLSIIAGCVLAGMIFAFAAAYFTDKLAARHNRYTYFEFLPRGMVFSEYAGEFIFRRERVVYRRLYYIPFDKFECAVRDPKVAPHNLTLKGEIRAFLLPDDRLGYHIDGDGNLTFDNFELNDHGSEALSSVTIKDRFGNTKRLEKSVNHFLEKFKSIPEKPQFDITKYVSTPKRKRMTTSNPALSAPSYERKWK